MLPTTRTALAAATALFSAALQAATNPQVYAYAEANYPDLFAGTATSGTYRQYEYRHYAASRNYLAIDTSGAIVLLGAATDNAPATVGTVADYADAIAAWEATATGQYRIVATGQAACYSSSGAATACAGTGQDAEHGGNAPSYTASADGRMVTDNVTGLLWTRDSDTDGDGAVDYADKLSPDEAADYCAGLALGGQSWRLPTIKELYSLILFSGRDASSYSGTDTATLVPFLDPAFDWAFGDLDAGDRIIDAQYASATRYVATTMGGGATMFGVNFVDGRIKGYPLTGKKYYVRCVAGSGAYGVNRFAANGDGTVSDHATGLMWEQGDHAAQDWDAALATCAAAATGGHADWRLPNAKELQSIVDYGRAPDSGGSAAIDPLFEATAFINEGGATDWGYYWTSTTHLTNEGNGSYAVYLSFGRALGYFAAGPGGRQVLDVHGAGAQRSDHKRTPAAVPGAQSGNAGHGDFHYHGPQGDILRSANLVRCVR
jgi:hypothetical protein